VFSPIWSCQDISQTSLFFIYTLESERSAFSNTFKRKIVYEYVERDQNLNLSDVQKRDIRKQVKTAEVDVKESIRKLYRLVAIHLKDGIKEIDLGIPTYGEQKALDEEVFEKLRFSSGKHLSVHS